MIDVKRFVTKRRIILGLCLLVIFAAYTSLKKPKYNHTCCVPEDMKIVHTGSGEDVIAPTIITSLSENGYLFGVRLPAKDWTCKTERANSILRLDLSPVYFVLNETKGSATHFEKNNETPLEFFNQTDFENHLKSLGLTGHENLQYDEVDSWIKTYTDRYERSYYKDCFGDENAD